MIEKEIEKITKILEDAGWQPHLCDTPIPTYESVHAGHLVDPGQIPPGMTLVPKAFLKVRSRGQAIDRFGKSMTCPQYDKVVNSRINPKYQISNIILVFEFGKYHGVNK